MKEVRSRPVAEYALLLMLTFAKRLRESFDLQRGKRWQRLGLHELHERTLGIVALGSIGSEIARLARTFGMTTVATRSDTGAGRTVPVDELLPSNRLADLLRRSDYVVLTAPSTPETFHLIGGPELEAMRHRGAD